MKLSLYNINEFTEQNFVVDSIVEFESNYPIDVFLVKSEHDYDNFANNLDYEAYEGCIVEERYSGRDKMYSIFRRNRCLEL